MDTPDGILFSVGYEVDEWLSGDLLRKLILPAEEGVVPGRFIEEQRRCLDALKLASMVNIHPLGIKSIAEKKWDFYAHLLDVAESIIEEGDIQLYPGAAITAAYIAMTLRDSEYEARINGMFDKMDRQFEVARSEATNNQALETCLMREFETFYCAGRMIPFEGNYISRRLHTSVDQLLSDFVNEYAKDFLYVNCIAMAASNMSEPDEARYFPNGEQMLWMNLVSIIHKFDKNICSVGMPEKDIIDDLVRMIDISWRIGTLLPQQSLLAEPIMTLFSTSWNAVLARDIDLASEVMETIQKFTQANRDIINPDFQAIADEKRAILAELEMLDFAKNEATQLPFRPHATDSAGNQNRASTKVAQPN